MTQSVVSGDLVALGPPDVRRGEIILYSTVGNQRERIPFMLDHHRRFGVDRFLIVDNASDDGTTEFLLRQDDIVVFHTAASSGETR